MSEEDAFNELCAYTWGLGDREFIHQLVVDAFNAQHANDETKPIALTFALIGLYLASKKNTWGGRFSACTCASPSESRFGPLLLFHPSEAR